MKNKINYDSLLEIVCLMQEWYNNVETKKKIKFERITWYETGIKCSCSRPRNEHGEYADGGEEYDGTCPFCIKRNEFYTRLNKLANRQRAIKNKIRHRVSEISCKDCSKYETCKDCVPPDSLICKMYSKKPDEKNNLHCTKEIKNPNNCNLNTTNCLF